jgi:hypothetical protein
VLNPEERGYIDVTSTKEPDKALEANAARKRISAILRSGHFIYYTRHSRLEMEKDDLIVTVWRKR